jgi:hypothetical protein
MRSDLGLHTIGQRLAGLADVGVSPRTRAAQAAPTATAFADALQAELDAVAPGRVGTPGTGTTGTGAVTGFDQLGAALPATAAPSWLDTAGQRPVALGQGVRLTGTDSVIVPSAGATSVEELLGLGTSGTQAADNRAHADHVDHVHEPVQLDRSGPPAELQAYGNGRIPADALAPVGVGDHRLWAPAAHGFQDLVAAAEAEGITIGVNSSYRSYEGQVDMVERYGLYSQGGRAAQPGTSNHGWGVAIDLQLDDRAQAWMRDNAERYGFVEDVPREPWHWTYYGS